MMQKNETIALHFDSNAFEGKAIGRYQGIPVFVKYGAAGDDATVRITIRKKDYAEGKLLSVDSPSPDRTAPVCRHFGTCGGCQWQHVTYTAQVEFKRVHVRDLLQRIGRLHNVEPLPVLPAPTPFGYRNKMEYTFSDLVWIPENAPEDYMQMFKAPAAGLHAPGRFDKIIDLQECHLAPATSYKLLHCVRAFAQKNDWRGYNTRTHEGFLRNLIVRNSVYSGEWLAALVTTAEHPGICELAAELKSSFPELATFIHIVHQKKSPNHAGGKESVLFGKGYIEDVIGGFHYQIHPLAFFQTNIVQANALFETAINLAELKYTDHVFDLYCGVGTITFMAAARAKMVTGIELSEEAIANAVLNAQFNKVENVRFVQGDMKDVFAKELLKTAGKPDVIITDPPRSGMHPDVVKILLEVAADRLVYVSCNPATMARDLALLSEKYDVHVVQPVDMFPQTYHIECVAQLKLKTV